MEQKTITYRKLTTNEVKNLFASILISYNSEYNDETYNCKPQ